MIRLIIVSAGDVPRLDEMGRSGAVVDSSAADICTADIRTADTCGADTSDEEEEPYGFFRPWGV